jgi:hypothetical protein
MCIGSGSRRIYWIMSVRRGSRTKRIWLTLEGKRVIRYLIVELWGI